MKRLLIIEDEETHFTAVYETLDRYLGEAVEIFPKVDNTEDGMEAWNELIDTALLGKTGFNDILAKYENIDLFVIDISLITNSKNESGKEFWKFARKKNPRAKFVLLTTADLYKDELNSKTEKYVPKSHQSTDDFVNQTLEEVCGLLNLKSALRAQKDKPTLAASGNTPVLNVEEATNETSVQDNDITFSSRERRELFGRSYALRRSVHELEGWAFRSLDMGIKFIFFLLIISASVYAAYEIIHSFFDPDIGSSRSYELAIAEHVFLFLLPVFIVFGFFIYYKANMSVYLSSGNPEKIREEISTKPMTLIKTLFIGSIISYLIIKTIELIFFPKDASSGPSVTILISIGVLIALLMIYFIAIERMNHRGNR